MRWPVVGWTTAVALLWVVFAALAADDCSGSSILCFDIGAMLTLLVLPALGVWLVGVCVIWIVRRVRRSSPPGDPGQP